MASPDLIRVVVAEARDAAEGVRLLTLRPSPADFARFGAAPLGSHIEVALKIGGLHRSRSYSVVEEVAGTWRIAVRRVQDSRGGSVAMWALRVGDTLRIAPPRSHFELSVGRPGYLLIAGGIGITPLFGMARALADRGAPFRLLYAGRSRAQMAFLTELDGLAELFTDDEGRMIDFAAAFADLHPEGEAYLCGPPGMLAAARTAWAAAGRLPALLRFETFGSGGIRDPEPFRVHVRDHGVTLEVPRDASLLDTLARAGIEVAQDCLRGECGLCAVQVCADAVIDHACVFLSEAQRVEGHRMCACVSRARGEVTIDTGYRPGLARA